MDETWWVCESCSSLNRRRAKKCYSCGTKIDWAAPAEIQEPIDGVTVIRSAKPENQPIAAVRAPELSPADQDWDAFELTPADATIIAAHASPGTSPDRRPLFANQDAEADPGATPGAGVVAGAGTAPDRRPLFANQDAQFELEATAAPGRLIGSQAVRALDRPFGRMSRVWTVVALASVVWFWLVAANPRI